jgi:multiple sugar transport system permease protein/raffinose/stachyose/melibiose transport system permease protein
MLVTAAFILPVYIALANAFKSRRSCRAPGCSPITLDNLATALNRRDHLVTSGSRTRSS